MATKSRSSAGLELSEYFNNEDSSGHRLAELFQKRRGGVQHGNFLFVQNEPHTISLDVQLEKVPQPSMEKAAQREVSNGEEHHKQASPPNEEVVMNTSTVKDAVGGDELRPGIEREAEKCEPIGFNPISPARNIRPLSPRVSAIRKSGGVSPSDRLRRYSFKRRTKFIQGKRALLQDFEDTVESSGFTPQVCSTPLSQDSGCNGAGTAVQPPSGVENITPNLDQEMKHTSNVRFSPFGCSDQLVNSLRSKNSNLRRIVEQQGDSTLRRTYTMERGQKPGQVILTPEVSSPPKENGGNKIVENGLTSIKHAKVPERMSATPNAISYSPKSLKPRSNDDAQSYQRQMAAREESDLCKSNYISGTRHVADMDISPQYSPEVHNTSLRSGNIRNNSDRNRSQITICFDNKHILHSPANDEANRDLTCNRSPIMLNRSKCGDSPLLSTSAHDVNTNTVRIAADTACTQTNCELMIPETQDLLVEKNNSIVIQSHNTKVPFVVIPVNQTFGQPLRDVTSVSTKNMGGEKGLCGQSTNAEFASGETMQQVQQAGMEPINSDTDNLKLTDIITDDDEDESMPKSVSGAIRNSSQFPLDLAGADNKNRVKILRKRSFPRRCLQKNNPQVMNMETEPLRLSLSNQRATRKRSLKRRQIPLNKPPGTPLNGEEFAAELARMSNYEILDLRKRNSLGRVFAISGRKSVLTKEQAVKKQVQLDDEIELELLRRNMDISNHETNEKSEEPSQKQIGEVDMVGEEVFLPAPEQFCDGIQPCKEKSPDNSLLDEQSCDRISFRTRSAASRQRKGNAMPDVLRHYLKISQKYSGRKNRRTMNRSKRSLYTRGMSDSEETICNSSKEKNGTKANSLQFAPSPPRLELDQMPPPTIVSPPPPLSSSVKDVRSTVVDVTVGQSAVPLSPQPPPPQFETDSGISCNNPVENQNSPLSRTTAIEFCGDTDTDVFKKPLQPPLKRNGRKKAVEQIPNSESSHSESSETSTESALRRSKRNVPLKNSTPLFQLLFQQVLNKQAQERKKYKLRENSKNSKQHKPDKSNRSVAKTEQKNCKPLATVLQTDTTDDHSHQNSPIKGKKKTKKKATKVTRQGGEMNKEGVDSSRIALNTLPPLDHFNSVFDRLRNSSQLEEGITHKENHAIPFTFKQKKVKVRVARLKKTDATKLQQSECDAGSHEIRSSRSDEQCTQSVPDNCTTVSSSGDSNQSNFELISWLKNITETDSVARSDAIFKEMRISSLSNLCFTELQGVEYAFYDTEDKASLGYLRFKPKQIKPRKRAKRYHLHFVTLVGNFRITANDKESTVGPGDMVAIEKSVFYDIENISDDVGILMVIKK